MSHTTQRTTKRTGHEPKLPTDDEMTTWRQAGMFVCSCSTPQPRWLGVWQCAECHVCGKLIVNYDAAMELFDRMHRAGQLKLVLP